MIASHGEQASALCRRGGTTEDKQVANTDPTGKGYASRNLLVPSTPKRYLFPSCDYCFEFLDVHLENFPWWQESRGHRAFYWEILKLVIFCQRFGEWQVCGRSSEVLLAMFHVLL